MKNIKDYLFEWRKHYIATLIGATLFTIPTVIVFLPSGYMFGGDASNFDVYKWFIFGFIVVSTIGHNILIARCENYEQTIEKMNDEVEWLKDEVKALKKKQKEEEE